MKNIKYLMSAATGFAGASMLWASTGLPQNTTISAIVMIVSITWISLFLYANEVHGRE